MRHTLSSSIRKIFLLTSASLCLLVCASLCAAQSSDANFPTPVRAGGSVAARIAPRDIGDARRTRHFYTFKAVEGDLSVTVEAAELIGDVDVFTATTFRPLLKVTLYGGATRATKSVYLRREETLILRVEARSVGDTDGSYTIRFGGAFAPAPDSVSEAPEASSAPTVGGAVNRDRGVRRVTSTGARIEEPVTESAASEEATTTPTSRAPDTASKGRPTEARETPRRRARGGTRPTTSTGTRRRGATGAPADTTGASKTSNGEDSASIGSTAGEATDGRAPATTNTPRSSRNSRPPAPRTPRRNAPNARRSESASRAADSASGAATVAPSQRLIVVTKDGETLERDMSAVRRVTVENNQLVILMKDGKTLRQPMSGVLRMTIEP